MLPQPTTSRGSRSAVEHEQGAKCLSGISPESGPGERLRAVRRRAESVGRHRDGGDLDLGFGGDGGVLEVSFAEPPVGGQPGEGSIDDPPVLDRMNACRDGVLTITISNPSMWAHFLRRWNTESARTMPSVERSRTADIFPIG